MNLHELDSFVNEMNFIEMYFVFYLFQNRLMDVEYFKYKKHSPKVLSGH